MLLRIFLKRRSNLPMSARNITLYFSEILRKFFEKIKNVLLLNCIDNYNYIIVNNYTRIEIYLLSTNFVMPYR